MMSCTRAFFVSVFLTACLPPHTGDSGASAGSATDVSSGGATSSTAESSTSQETEGMGTSAGDCGEVVGEGDKCDIGCQNCPPGEKCVIAGDSGMSVAVCKPIPDDPKGEGEPCESLGDPADGLDDCDRGYACVGYPLLSSPSCVPLCKGGDGESQCSGDSRCLNVGDGPVCAAICDPRAENECEGGCRPVDQVCSHCFPMKATGTFSCWIAPPTQEGVGFACPFGECLETLFCAPPGRVPGCDEATPCCTEYCSVEAPSCPDETVCVPVYEVGQAPVLLETLGACLTP